MEQRTPLLMESGLNWLTQKVKEYKVPLFASFLFGMLAYGFYFTNKLVNHDEVSALFGKGGTYTSGRWGLHFLERVFPNISMPWIYGIITISLISVSVCILCCIFQIRGRLLQVLLAGSILAFPSLTGTFSYMFTSSSYGVSFLLAVLAVLFMEKPSKLSILPALGCMVLSLSIYQAYVSVTASLLVLILIQRLLRKDDVGSILRSGIFYVLFLAAALGIYYAATLLILRITGNSFSGYADGGMQFRLADIPQKIILAYTSFYAFFLDGFLGLIPTAFSRTMHKILLGACGLLLVLWGTAQKKSDLPRLLLLAALLGIFPLAVNCMYLFSAEDAVHTLVLYGFVSFYVLAAVLAEACPVSISEGRFSSLLQRAGLEAATLAMVFILISNIYTANAVSVSLYLRYENAYSFYTALAAQIQMQPGFDGSTKLAVVGEYNSPDFYSEKFGQISHITGTHGFLPDQYSKERFVQYYLGSPIVFASIEETQAIQNTETYSQMPIYPCYGSIRFIGDILVVKLS